MAAGAVAVQAMPEVLLTVDDKRKSGVIQEFLEELFPRLSHGEEIRRARVVAWRLQEDQLESITRVVLQDEDIQSYANHLELSVESIQVRIQQGLNVLKGGCGVKKIADVLRIAGEKGFL